MNRSVLLLARTAYFVVLSPVCGADTIYSGPQPGEKTTAFKVLEVAGPNQGKERDPIAENAGAPSALVFIHVIERSLLPLLRVVDEYGAGRKDSLKTEVVFLLADRVAGEERAKTVAGSLKLQSRTGLSLDGAEGPGNYGLNKECMMTIVIAKDNKVTANFALVQPGITHAPDIIKALAAVSGDPAPPPVDQLTERQLARSGGAGRGMRDGARTERRGAAPVDFEKFDLKSEAGLREAVKGLMVEVQSLRAEVAALKGQSSPTPDRAPEAARPKEGFPGAVPDDATLNSLLRRAIRPTNDDATVDQIMAEFEAHIKDKPDLVRQAVNGWTRVLHFGDHYGTAYSRKAGQAFLDRHKASATK